MSEQTQPCVVMSQAEWQVLPAAVKWREGDQQGAWFEDPATGQLVRLPVWVHDVAAQAARWLPSTAEEPTP